jgi:hypothetical protein
MKQTAVEWLYNNLKSHFEHDGDLLEAVQFSFEQAKDMEMTQITEAFDDGFENHYDADLYFNKKFKPGYKNEN